MGNRAYLTIRNETHYVHWNGGLDTICPMLEAIQTMILDHKLAPTNEEIRQAFFKFCQSKMEVTDAAVSSYEKRQWIEENGHYFFADDLKTIIHRFEVHNKKTDMYDIHSDIIKWSYDYFDGHFLSKIKEDYRETAKAEYPERVKMFVNAFNELMAARIEEEKAFQAKLKDDAKKTFKTLIKEDLKKDFPSILPKLKSVKQSTYSMGCSVYITCIDLEADELAYMKKLAREYQHGSFNGMTDCYEYDQGESRKARQANYVTVKNEKGEMIA